MERLWRAAMLVMLGTCFAKPEDWYDVNDIDGHIAGQQFACGVCNVLVAATTDLLKAKIPEDRMQKFFNMACDKAQTDTEKRELCHRIVEDAGQDVIDEISLGTPSDEVCKKLEMCVKLTKEKARKNAQLLKELRDSEKEKQRYAEEQKKKLLEEKRRRGEDDF